MLKMNTVTDMITDHQHTHTHPYTHMCACVHISTYQALKLSWHCSSTSPSPRRVCVCCQSVISMPSVATFFSRGSRRNLGFRKLLTVMQH